MKEVELEFDLEKIQTANASFHVFGETNSHAYTITTKDGLNETAFELVKSEAIKEESVEKVQELKAVES